MFNLFKKNKKDDSPNSLDWGAVTPEMYSQEKNKAVYVLNFSLVSEEAQELSKQFTIGRIIWYQQHLPENCAHEITLDLRGQTEITFELEMQDGWRNEVYQTVRDRVPGINIEINILIGDA